LSKPSYTDSFIGGYSAGTPAACSGNDLIRQYTINLPTASTVLMQLWSYNGTENRQNKRTEVLPDISLA